MNYVTHEPDGDGSVVFNIEISRHSRVNKIAETLAGSAKAPAVAELAERFGTSPQATRQAVASVIGALSQRLERNTLSRGGLAELVKAIGDPHHTFYLDHPELLGSPYMETDGKAILEHILGSKDASRGVAARAARQSGLNAATVEDMLPSIAAMMMGQVSRAASGPIDDILRRIPGLEDMLREMGQRGGAPGFPGGPSGPREGERETWPSGGDTGDWQLPETGRGPSSPPGGGGPIPEQQPLPIPGEFPGRANRAPSRYDDLSDILRRGGFRIPKDAPSLPEPVPGGAGNAGGGTLYNIIRALIGALLGFQSRGLLGWLIRLIVVRWGWRLLQNILGRILLGRR